ncbi:MAG: hypothetical protein LBD27_01500 [Tannerella sp.]|jgi:hypothetical protein|nr:hypothetical protein [Tannerella sp.]
MILIAGLIASTDLQAQDSAGINSVADSLERMLERDELSDDERVDIYGQFERTVCPDWLRRPRKACRKTFGFKNSLFE